MRRLWLVAALTAACGAASAEPLELSGTIGGKPVYLELNRTGDTVSGWYIPLKTGKQIRLDGKLDHNGFFDIDEHTADTNTRTGSFSGRIKNRHWAGTWKNAAGKTPRPLAFDPIGRQIAADGHYRCTARRKDDSFGFTLSHSAELTLVKGRVKALTLIRSSKADGEDRQTCRLTARDLKQVPSQTAIEMKAKAAPARCTLRIVAAGDYLILRPGQQSQAGDDCRGQGPRAFCAPHALWTDLVLNRKTQSCRSVE